MSARNNNFDASVKGNGNEVINNTENVNITQQSQQLSMRGGNDGYYAAMQGRQDSHMEHVPPCEIYNGGGGGCEAPQQQSGGPFGSLFAGLPNPESLLSGLMGGQGDQGGGSPLSGIGSILGNQGGGDSQSGGGSGGIGGTGITAGEVASVAAIFA